MLTLADSTLTVSNVLSLGSSSKLNFGLGTTATDRRHRQPDPRRHVQHLDAGGFTNATYTLLTYSGALTDNGVTIGSTPNATFTYTVDTNTVGVVKLDVTSASCGVGAAGPIPGPPRLPLGRMAWPTRFPVSAAHTTYTWTVPSGATIASGQGTTSITVNYRVCGSFR